MTGVTDAASRSSMVGWQLMQQSPAPQAAAIAGIEQAPRSISRTIRRSFTPWHEHTNAITS